MNTQCYDLDENATEKELIDVVVNVFTQTKYIYFMIPDFYFELKNQLFDKYIGIFENKKFVIGYLEDNELEYLYEFFERGISLPFVITNKKIDYLFENVASYNYDKFYDFFEKKNITHMKLGPDSESFIYLKE